MPDTPVFQRHHIIEQQAFEDSRLLQKLSEQRLFELHGPSNMLNLPADRALAAQLGISPHPGGPLGEYSNGLRDALDDLADTVDGQAVLRGDQAAAQRIAVRVDVITDTLKAGLVNGDLLTNTPQGMTPEQANARTRAFFGDLDGYQQRHAAQIAEIGRMPAHEARWAGVTRSEGKVAAALDAIEQPGVKPVAGDPAAGRQSLGTAVAQANEAGRLPLSESIEARLRAAFPQEMPPTLARAPAVPDVDSPHSGAPGAGRAMRVVGAAGVALMAYDFASTGHRVLELRAQGNEAAAEAAETRFVGRNAGGLLVGVGAGVAYGAATGSWTGPGALLTGAVGGVAGAYLGDKWADQQQHDQINIQPDQVKNTWTRSSEDPRGAWLREESLPNSTGGYDTTRLLAVGRLVDELNYKAANDSYSLGLGNPPVPQNPFRLDASGATQPPRAPFETDRDYVRDAQTGQWQLEIREVLDGRIPMTRHEPVSTERATELDRQSALIVANNAANTPAVIAARYQIAYDQFGWNEFASVEPVPGVIRNSAAQTQTLPASDGNTYTRGADGEWTTHGDTNQASGNIREEMNRTWQSQQAGLQQLSEYAAIARANPTPTEYGLRNVVADAYARTGVVRSDADIDVATRAVAQDHARDGLGQSPYTLELQPDGSIATFVGRDDRRMETKSVTTTAEIEQVRTDMTTAPHAIERASENGRDAREQAQREGSRQGLSQDQVQQAVQGAAAITMRGASSAHATDVESPMRQDDAPPSRQARPSPQAESLPPPPMRDPRQEDARERESAQRARTDAPAALPPDFAPSRQQSPDVRNPEHPGHDAFREMRHKVSLHEARQSIPDGEHTDRVAAGMLQLAVENKIPPYNASIVKDPATGQTHLLDRTNPFQSEHQCLRVEMNMMQLSSQSIADSSQRLDETVSRHQATPAQAQERTQQQSQALAGLGFDDQVMFARIRRDVPGHVSDDHVGLAMKNAKQEGMRDAGSIGTVMMIGDQLYLRGQGEAAKDLTVDVTKTAPAMQASVEATNTLNEQRTQRLAQQQSNPTQDDPAPKGPKL